MLDVVNLGALLHDTPRSQVAGFSFVFVKNYNTVSIVMKTKGATENSGVSFEFG